MSAVRRAARVPRLLGSFCLTTALVLAAPSAPRAAGEGAGAAPAPAVLPSPSPGLALSDKPGPGCCCITTAPGKEPACTDGLQEAACRSAARAVAQWTGTWVEGKCAQP